MTLTPPFNIAYRFDDNLRELPEDRNDVQRAIAWWRARLSQADSVQRVALLGYIGGYSRMLSALDEAEATLTEAVALADQLGDARSALVNRIRLAHVYQWQRDFVRSNARFAEILQRCEDEPKAEFYLDFALQHAGKNQYDQNHLEAAQSLFERALVLRRAKGNTEFIASTEQALLRVHQRLDSD